MEHTEELYKEEHAEFIADEEVADVVADEDEDGISPMDEDNDDDYENTNTEENPLPNNDDDDDMEELTDDSVQGFFDHKAPVYTVAIHPQDQHLVATGGGDDKLYLWRLDTGLTLRQLEGHSDSVTCVAFSANGQYVASGGMDGKVRVYVAVSGDFVVELEGPDELVWIDWHPKGNILLGGASDGTIWMWTVPNGICMRVFAGHSAPVTSGSFTPDGKKIVSVSEDSSFILWDPKTSAATIRLSGDDARFHTGPVTSVAVNKENTLAITGCVDGTARLINLISGVILAALDNHSESIESTGFCDVLPLAATGGVDAKVSIWDVQTFHLRTTLIGHQGAITHLVWHKDSPLVTTCSADRTIRTWDARTGQCLKTRAGHQDTILCLAITLDDADESTIDLISSATKYLVIEEDLTPRQKISPETPRAEPRPRPHVHVECCLKSETTEPFESVKVVVESYLKNCKAALFTHSEITLDFADESASYLSKHLERLRVCEAAGDSSDVYALEDIDLYVHVYQLQEEGAVEEVSEEENVLMANHWMLPSMELEGLWESLIYDNDVQLKLLDYVSTTMLFSDCHVDPNIISWNRVVLLYGPPGTGKTSLCRALAQKLSIRLANKYTYGKLVEINSHSLFSKWFSESGKLVQRMFQKIRDLIENEDAFVCVLIDEVESLAAARKSAALGTEPSDAIRVVNALLTQIDQLKQRPNVLILTTSNISQAIDVAFVDRADIKQFIGLPGQKAVYSILSSCIRELSRVGIIRNHAPLLDWRAVHLFRDVDNTSSEPSRKLYDLAGKCQGMSGRSLRKLPFLTHAFHLRVSERVTVLIPSFLYKVDFLPVTPQVFRLHVGQISYCACSHGCRGGRRTKTFSMNSYPSRKMQSIDSSYLWLVLYFFLNLTLTLYNKIVLEYFQFPWMLTGIHTLVGATGSYALYYFGFFTPAKLGDRESIVMLAFSILYTINIAISNVSLKMVSVPFHQVVRATTPIFTIFLSVMFLNKSYPTMIYISLLPVVLGVAFATAGEDQGGRSTTTLGFILTVLGAILAAIKTVVTNRVQVGRLKLHPLDLLLRMSPLAFMQTVIYAYLKGELDDIREYTKAGMFTSGVAWGLLLNGSIAFFLNVVSFTANKKTSALTMTVAANVKQVLSIVMAVMIFSYNITITRGIGILLTLFGGGWYSYLENQEKIRQRRLSPVDGLAESVENLSSEKLLR